MIAAGLSLPLPLASVVVPYRPVDTEAPAIGPPPPQTVTWPSRVPDGPATQLGNLKLPMRSRHPTGLETGTYWLTYQNVQSSTGSTFIEV